MRFTLVTITSAMLAISGPAMAKPVKVEIKGTPGHYQLYRDGQAYKVRGAGGGDFRLDLLKSIGGNSIRTWNVGDGSILDAAAANGLTVALCLDVGRERLGFDYNNPRSVKAQLEKFRDQVERFKDHPALLVWIIGNELNYGAKGSAVWKAVNDISKMIHEVDPDHPTTTALAGISPSMYDTLRRYSPDLDFISVQLYGGLPGLPAMLDKIDPKLPIMVTEWGTVGHWETDKTRWGAPIELNSSQKAQTYRKGYQDILAPLKGRSIGSYAFLWGYKQERTPTWYGIFSPGGHPTEVVDVLQYAWQGRWPNNRSPKLDQLTLNGERASASVTLAPGKVYPASVKASDPEGQPLAYEWVVRYESTSTKSGGDEEKIPKILHGLISNQERANVELRAPAQPGEYRLFVYVRDPAKRTAYANIPFLVKQ